ncbi:MAG: class I SAM-dependent methyltransferase [Campylobacterota bacterium]|nr:class I SAM-dependent methyltransferase [Campylobacterota bacterium]
MSAKLNLSFYSGEDYYSDGDIEDELLEIVKKSSDFDEILANDSRWPILYHLSPIRNNIINWYPFEDDASCLEIGGGCGAITGALCDLLDRVTVVELSKRRSMINYERHKEYENLEIIVGNLNDIVFEQKFDYITLNGVLEYAGAFTQSTQPYRDFLLKVKSMLKPKGRLIIAIENRYGLKYFAGAKEDHTAKEFDGITGYIGNKSVRTFGKLEIEQLLIESGFRQQTFYYPHPDYKMPMEIYSEDWLPNADRLLSPAPNFDHERFEYFDEREAFKGIVENRQFEFFANSFLIVCGE